MTDVPRRSLIAGIGVIAVAALGAVASADHWAPVDGEAAPTPTVVSASPLSVSLACPTGTMDPFNTSAAAAEPGAWTTTGVSAGDKAPASIDVDADDGETLEMPSGFIVSGQGGGELLGLSTTGCAAASSEQWIAFGSTIVGEDLVLLLSNPSDTASIVSVTGYGATGVIDEVPQQVTVPAGQTIAVLPVGWFPDQTRLALRISADGPGVAAWAQSSAMDGEVPAGTAWIPSTRPQTSQIIGGIDPEADTSLRIGVPSEDAAHVVVSVIDSRGTRRIAGADLDVDGGTVLDIPLGGISTDDQPIAVLVESDGAVVAQASSTTTGADYPNSDSSWGIRTALSPAASLTTAEVPGAAEITALVTEQLKAEPLRATSQDTDSGVLDITARMLLIAPASAPTDSGPTSGAAQSGADDAQSAAGEEPRGGSVTTVTVGDEEIELNTGTTAVVDLPEDPSSIRADTPIRAVLIIEAQTPSGTVRSLWPIGTLGITTRSAAVAVND